MSNAFYRILSYLVITSFLIYWLVIFILAMPSNYAKHAIGKNIPQLRNLLGNSWKLFSPPHTYNNRLYFITMEVNKQEEPDTIEALSSLSAQKQTSSQFNQRLNILDRLVNNNVTGLLVTTWGNRNLQPGGDTATSSEIALAISKVENNNDYKSHMATLLNYCKRLLNEKHIDSRGKQVKIIIAQKMITPFKEIANKHFLQRETIVFQSHYMPFN